MSLEIKIPSTLNEMLIGKCNMEFPDKKIDIDGAVPVGYADAINKRIDTVKQLEDDFKEQDKNTDEFVKMNHEREPKVKGTEEMKKMKLSESLFDEGCDVEMVDNVEESYTPATKLYKQAEEIADYIDDFQAALADFEDTDEYLPYNAFDLMDQLSATLHEFAFAYSHVMDNEDVFEGLNEGKTEDELRAEYKDLKAEAEKFGEEVPQELQDKIHAKAMEIVDAKIASVGKKEESCEVTECDDASLEEDEKKKRSRGPNLKPEDKLPSDDDLWLKVYDELSAEVDPEGPSGDVRKELKARKGSRYQEVYPYGDNDIVVYGTSPEDFSFAKEVADHYGVTMEGPKEDRNKRSNSYYKYYAVMRIPA